MTPSRSRCAGPRHPVERAALIALSTSAGALLLACAAPADRTTAQAQAAMARMSSQDLPRLSAARPGILQTCTELPGKLTLPGVRIVSAVNEIAGPLRATTGNVAAHCLVTGLVAERQSKVDGQAYAINFQMRLPLAWNGRFFHQGNGGLDGFVTDATGAVSGGGPLTSALQQGFAVLSSDAGHTVRQLPLFGLDPQARLDYGYQAVARLTPVGRAVIAAAYGREPDRAYFGGCSNGGRHALVTAARYGDQYDGILAGDPGIRLPNAALAQLWGAQQWNRVATDPKDLASALTPAERKLVADRITQRCDALDGLADGMVLDTAACQRAFDLALDVPTCTAGRDGSCLSAEQKTVLTQVVAGARDAHGRTLYSGFPWDPGMAGADWASWKFVSSVTNRDPVAMAYVFQTPPAGPEAAKDPRAFALNFPVDRGLDLIAATQAPFNESSLSFMQPPASDLGALRNHGGKVLVFHGTGDGVFSSDDTVAWYQRLASSHGGQADDFARLYLVPAMNHCRAGPATDQFDLLGALVDWVEQGRAPSAVPARVRGAGTPVPNNELPSGWAADRSRPLCPWPTVARYNGIGDSERAENFSCK
jgi:feruloyl esterase